jgi:O-antigen/teichoic acid export membrane protein
LLLQQSIEIIAIYLALRWPVALYVGMLTGMQRMDWLNTVKVGTTSFRLIGGVAVLLLYKSLTAFLIWTAFNAIIEVWAYWLACRHVHPNMPKLPKIVIPALRRVWRFSASMNVLAILTILIVQYDRLIISKLLTLEQLGVYSLAYSAAAIVTAITAAFGAATLPWFSATHGIGDLINLRKNYYAATRSLIYVAGFIASIFIFFGFPLLSAWVNPTVALSARIPLALLAMGFWISATIACAAQIAIASGYTRILLRISSVSAPLYFLILYLLVLRFGVNGAALAWLILNLFYLVCLVPIIHKQILQLGIGVFFIRIIFLRYRGHLNLLFLDPPVLYISVLDFFYWGQTSKEWRVHFCALRCININ